MISPSRIPPPSTALLELSYPAPAVVLVTIKRERAMNSINSQLAYEMAQVWKWLDAEPTLLVAILTGSGNRAFCVGADLKEWAGSITSGPSQSAASASMPDKEMGDADTVLSRRRGKKPILAAVNGMALGGGMEFVTNCDLVIASETATFGLPEVKRGLSPFAGVLPRLIRNLGLQRASELALTGRTLTADEAYRWGFVNKVVPQNDVVNEAVKYASMIADNSPDAVICTRAGLREGWAKADIDDAVMTTAKNEFAALQRGENAIEGLRAFKEKRKPRWVESKL